MVSSFAQVIEALYIELDNESVTKHVHKDMLCAFSVDTTVVVTVGNVKQLHDLKHNGDIHCDF